MASGDPFVIFKHFCFLSSVYPLLHFFILTEKSYKITLETRLKTILLYSLLYMDRQICNGDHCSCEKLT